MLEARNLSKSFNGKKILDNINFKLSDGEILTVVGPSGAGKTTLLRIVAGLENKDSGQLILDGREYDPSIEQKVGVVFQDYNLFPNLSVLENITLAPIMVLKQSKEEAEANACQLLADLDMTGREKQYPFQLSGGQKQRVAIARALAMKPEILCYDEPTSALDPSTRDQVTEMILDLKNSGYTQFIITHDMDFAKKVSDQVLKIEPIGEVK
ncbi:polar amino acid transport system ATP-binding protein [Lactobacillus colini]|uniref:Polar amino acid transport system ATP-binding protein n=1 Tax=Lactobacillus colini TaxID=1819254 RepID=A0ABS4MFD9_9LACO|nr:amino acid ABC transporter ATP-binding protein [Lactobacillus colini]MBP2058084.1 polar amino acid transport system ATP-binding protein [Lactobacillus colini]